MEKSRIQSVCRRREWISLWPIIALLSLSLLLLPRGDFSKTYATPNAREKQRVAVLELRNRAGLPVDTVVYLTALVRKAAARLPQSRFSLMTKENIVTLLPPGQSIEDCLKECEVETGRALGVHWLITGQVIKFGASLRIVLNLHHTKSGELRGEPKTIKANKVEDFELPVQAAALELFSALDPNISNQANRVRSGVIFEVPDTPALPSLPNIDALNSLRPTSMAPQHSPKISAQRLSALNVDALEAYDVAMLIDKDPSKSPEDKLRAWKKVESFSETASLAAPVVQRWAGIVRQEKVRGEKIAQAIKEIKEIQREDQERLRKRAKSLEQDWKKVKRLIRLKSFDQAQKKDWVEAFFDAYGVLPKLNPKVNASEAQPYLKQLKDRLPDMKANSKAILQSQKKRDADILDRLFKLNQQTKTFKKNMRTLEGRLQRLRDDLTRLKKRVISLNTKGPSKNISVDRSLARDLKGMVSVAQQTSRKLNASNPPLSEEYYGLFLQIKEALAPLLERITRYNDQERADQKMNADRVALKKRKKKALKAQAKRDKTALKSRENGGSALNPFMTVNHLNESVGFSPYQFRSDGMIFHILELGMGLDDRFDLSLKFNYFRMFLPFATFDNGLHHLGFTLDLGAHFSFNEGRDVTGPDIDLFFERLLGEEGSKKYTSITSYDQRCMTLFDVEAMPIGIGYTLTFSNGTNLTFSYEIPLLSVTDLEIHPKSYDGGCQEDETLQSDSEVFEFFGQHRGRFRFALQW